MVNNQQNTYAEELLVKECHFYKQRIEYSKKHEANLQTTLKQITTAKSYRIWQKVAKVKRGVSLLLDPQSMLYTAKYLKEMVFGTRNVNMQFAELNRQEKKYIELMPEISRKKSFSNVTIVIPTYNGEEELPRLLKAIQTQRRIGTPEIIIIDSESKDKTKEIAEQYGCVFMTVKKGTFNHGETRNTAAQKANGKYIIFTVQDQIPLNRNTFADLLTILTSSEEVVAASTRQIPFPDADIFAKWQILNHLSALNLNDINFTISYKDEVEFHKQPFLLKRKLALLDDVCCAVKKKEFFLLGGYRKIDFAEDVDLAMRALAKDYSIGFLGTNGVIHSHTRPITYFLNRSYADVNTLHTMFQETIPSMFSSLEELLSVAFRLYKKRLPTTKDDPFTLYLKSLIQKLDFKLLKEETTVQAAEVYWELFNNIRNQAYHLFTQEISEEDKSLFSQKLFSSLIGSQIAIYMLDPKTEKNDALIKKATSLLLKNV